MNNNQETFDTWWKLLPAAVKEMEEEIVCKSSTVNQESVLKSYKLENQVNNLQNNNLMKTRMRRVT